MAPDTCWRMQTCRQIATCIMLHTVTCKVQLQTTATPTPLPQLCPPPPPYTAANLQSPKYQCYCLLNTTLFSQYQERWYCLKRQVWGTFLRNFKTWTQKTGGKWLNHSQFTSEWKIRNKIIAQIITILLVFNLLVIKLWKQNKILYYVV